MPVLHLVLVDPSSGSNMGKSRKEN
eukprot:COSAG06_NODE_66753_length_253_cov_1.259740_1_plen_24_part_10